MRKAVTSVFALALLLSLSCANKVTLPIKTSLGDLVKIESKDKVTTNKETISPKPEEVIYVLSFEGKKEIEVKDVALSEAYQLRQFPLVDSNGKEFTPAFVGSPTKSGSLSSADVRLSGDTTGRGGAFWVTAGKLDFPESKVTLVYVVPKNATLAFKNGGQQHPIN